MRRPFFALAFRRFDSSLNSSTGRAIPLIVRLGDKACLTDLTPLLIDRLYNAGRQFLVGGKHGIFEIAAVDSIAADTLHAEMFFSVVQQKAVAAHIIAAELFDEGINLPAL